MAIQNLTVCDQQHSVLASAGAVRSYPPYGVLSAAIGPRLAYCGQVREASTGFYHLGNGYRSYDPDLMRFLSPDALSPFAKGGINAYAYCAGDPINYQDPNGRAARRVAGPVTWGKVPEGWAPGSGSIRNLPGATGYGGASSTPAYDSGSGGDKFSNIAISLGVVSATTDATLLLKNAGALVNMGLATIGRGPIGASRPTLKQVAVTTGAFIANGASLTATLLGSQRVAETAFFHSSSPPATDLTLATVFSDTTVKGLSLVLSIAAHRQGEDYQLPMFKTNNQAQGPEVVALNTV
ncbi:RHS repeat-associated core domain-containing protein [Pseudomonas sp. CCOS 191]|uniref:RHS repeat-associated core domain-containing protein n=1 Tax=Pseudomonas sp. CCOS 191 TaxID=1649877 RepID=UPI0018E692C6|nr:RHS repeat-associated core domain-containing protein [Pseudomonas sp. CCOS 191]MBI6951649.1 RHS repeat-associated core domain-containing protein [Pseudomonas sp. CCOS 191]